MLSQLDNVHTAIASLTEEIASAPSPELYLRRCKAYATLKQMPEAFADCRQAITLDPNHAGAHNYLAGLLIQQGQFEEAEAEAATAATLDPEIGEVFLLVAYEGNRLTKKLAEAPTAPLYNKRGVLLMQQGALEPARADLEQAIALDPKLAIAYTNLIDVLIKLALPLEAEKMLDTISDADPAYQNASTVLIKKWSLLERRNKLAPSPTALSQLMGLAVAQESVPALQAAKGYNQEHQQLMAPVLRARRAPQPNASGEVLAPQPQEQPKVDY